MLTNKDQVIAAINNINLDTTNRRLLEVELSEELVKEIITATYGPDMDFWGEVLDCLTINNMFIVYQSDVEGLMEYAVEAMLCKRCGTTIIENSCRCEWFMP
jgi:hypothetical protein